MYIYIAFGVGLFCLIYRVYNKTRKASTHDEMMVLYIYIHMLSLLFLAEYRLFYRALFAKETYNLHMLSLLFVVGLFCLLDELYNQTHEVCTYDKHHQAST